MGDGLFDRLAADLSVQERLEMLERIKLAVKVDSEPIAPTDEGEQFDFGRIYGELSFISRMWLALKVFFTRRDRISLLQEIVLRRLGVLIERRAPLCFSARRLELGNLFYTETDYLASVLSHLVEPLKTALGTQCREFVALLASLELPAAHSRLVEACEPLASTDSANPEDEPGMRREIVEAVTSAIDEIAEDERALMRLDMTMLRALDGLARFPYERIMGPFEKRGDIRYCPVQLVVKPLQELASLLGTLTLPPGLRLLEALFLFAVRDEPTTAGTEKLVADMIRRTNVAIEALRSFNFRIPLVDILRFSLGEIDWTASVVRGGEDWLALYRQYWEERVERSLSARSAHRRRSELLAQSTAFVNLARLPLLPNYRSEKWGGSLVRFELSVAFIVGFVNHVFAREINRAVRIFLIDGRFYKEQNRLDFTECYNRTVRLPDEANRFDSGLVAPGEWGRAIDVALAEPLGEIARQKRLDAIFKQVNKTAAELVADTIASFELFANLIFGILHGNGDSVFDTVSNRSLIGGRENQRLLASLAHGLELLRKGNKLLSDLWTLERGEPL